MDEFELVSAAGAGTIVIMKKWTDVTPEDARRRA
jgi:hypothetical protein